MKITIESTPEVGTVEVGDCRVPARIWEGTTESGIPVLAFVVRIGVADGHDPVDFVRELIEAPTTIVLEGPS